MPLHEFFKSNYCSNLIGLIGVCAAGAAAYYAFISAQAGQRQALIAQETLSATSRPWLEVNVSSKPNQPIEINPDGLLDTGISVNLHNYGSAPATDVKSNSVFLLLLDNKTKQREETGIPELINKSCEMMNENVPSSMNKNQNKLPVGAVVFPSGGYDYYTGGHYIIPKEGIRAYAIIQAICVRYNQGPNKHETGIAVAFFRKSKEYPQVGSSRTFSLRLDGQSPDEWDLSLVPGKAIAGDQIGIQQLQLYSLAN